MFKGQGKITSPAASSPRTSKILGLQRIHEMSAHKGKPNQRSSSSGASADNFITTQDLAAQLKAQEQSLLASMKTLLSEEINKSTKKAVSAAVSNLNAEINKRSKYGFRNLVYLIDDNSNDDEVVKGDRWCNIIRCKCHLLFPNMFAVVLI